MGALSICRSPAGTPAPALGVMLQPLKGWCNLEPSESQGLAFLSAAGPEHEQG